jgi:hypothetical protein
MTKSAAKLKYGGTETPRGPSSQVCPTPMKTRALIGFIVMVTVRAVAAEPSPPLVLTAAYYEAWERRDLGTLTGLFHTQSLIGHRRYVEIALLKLTRTYGEKAVEAMMGKSRAQLAGMSDVEFLLFTVGAAGELCETAPQPKKGGVKLIGELVDGPRVHTVASVALVFAEGNRRIDLERRETLTFQREKGEWKVQSFPFGETVARIYAEELGKAAKAVDEKPPMKSAAESGEQRR